MTAKTYAILTGFLNNTHDTSGNRYELTGMSLAARFAKPHHFMRLLNFLLPNVMTSTSVFGSKNGITKINPNYNSIVSRDYRTVSGTLWVNTQFESDCVFHRLQLLEAYGSTVEITSHINGKNHIVTFDIKFGETPPAKDAKAKPENTEAVTAKPEDENGQNIFFAPETRQAVQLIRGVFHLGAMRISEIDEEIKVLQERRKEIENNLKCIKNTIGA